MKKTTKVIAMAIAAALMTSNIVLASPASDLKQAKTNLKAAQDQRQTLESNIEMLDTQIEKSMSAIDANKKQITKVQQDIKTAESDLKAAEDSTKQESDLFKQRMRGMYISGFSGYIQLLFEADSLGDLISKTEAVGKIIGYDNKIIGDLKAKQEAVKVKKDQLSKENDKLLAIESDSEKKIAKLNSDKSNQLTLIAEAKNQEKLYASKVDSSQAAVNAELKQIASIRQAAPKLTLSRGSAPISDNSVIAYATNFLGTPYVWGGSTPAGFDCSGFTQYVYRHFGISIGRTTFDQINDGYEVSMDQLQPGDLIFFGTWGNPHHVGIYVGNGTYIHAPHTGDVVKISSLGRSDYLTARRVK